jgi:hypothetical protein
MHAVMALAGHHLNSPSALSHRHASLHLLRQSLGVYNDAETMYSVLDTIIILFSLDVGAMFASTWSEVEADCGPGNSIHAWELEYTSQGSICPARSLRWDKRNFAFL